MRFLFVLALLVVPTSFADVAEVPFPTGVCAGIFSGKNAPPTDTGESSSGQASIVIDFDNEEIYGILSILHKADEFEDVVIKEWNLNQSGNGTPFTITRDEFLPAAFVLSNTLQVPTDDFTFEGLESPIGNPFFEEPSEIRLISVNGGKTFLIDDMLTDYTGVCQII